MSAGLPIIIRFDDAFRDRVVPFVPRKLRRTYCYTYILTYLLVSHVVRARWTGVEFCCVRVRALSICRIRMLTRSIRARKRSVRHFRGNPPSVQGFISRCHNTFVVRDEKPTVRN